MHKGGKESAGASMKARADLAQVLGSETQNTFAAAMAIVASGTPDAAGAVTPLSQSPEREPERRARVCRVRPLVASVRLGRLKTADQPLRAVSL